MAKNSAILQQFLEINGKTEQLSSQINSAKNALSSSDIYKFETQMEKVMKTSEKITLRIRELANQSFKFSNNPLAYNRISNEIADNIYKINITKLGRIFKITLPCTIPHYGNISKTILTQPLNDSLKRYNKEEKIDKFESAVMVFINHTSNKNIAHIRDNDNYDYKQIVNTLAFWFLPDDSFKCCNTFNLTQMDEENFTEVYIVPSDQFIDFYKENIKL